MSQAAMAVLDMALSEIVKDSFLAEKDIETLGKFFLPSKYGSGGKLPGKSGNEETLSFAYRCPITNKHRRQTIVVKEEMYSWTIINISDSLVFGGRDSLSSARENDTYDTVEAMIVRQTLWSDNVLETSNKKSFVA